METTVVRVNGIYEEVTNFVNMITKKNEDIFNENGIWIAHEEIYVLMYKNGNVYYKHIYETIDKKEIKFYKVEF